MDNNGTSQPTGPLNYDGLGRTARYFLTLRPVETALRKKYVQKVVSIPDLVQFLLDNNVQVPPNSISFINREPIENMVFELIAQNPELPPNYQTQDRDKDKSNVDQFFRTFFAPLPTSSTAVDNQTTVMANPPVLQPGPSMIPPLAAQSYLARCAPHEQRYLQLTAKIFGGWESPTAKMVLDAHMKIIRTSPPRQPVIQAQPAVSLVARLPTQKPPPLKGYHCDSWSIQQPQSVYNSAPTSSGAAAAAAAADTKDARVATLDDGPQWGCQARRTVDSADSEMPSCTCKVVLDSIVEHTRLPERFVEYLKSKLPATVESLVNDITTFGYGRLVRTSGCRLVLLTQLCNLLIKKVQAPSSSEPGPRRVEVAGPSSSSSVPATGTKRKAVEEKEGKGQSVSQPQEDAKKPRGLQNVLVVHPRDEGRVFKRIRKNDLNYVYVMEKMNNVAISNGRELKLKFRIKQIVRVWNKQSYAEYLHSRNKIGEKNGGVHNEFHLFHGSPSYDKIIREGFDERCAKMDGMFGAGLYFAEHAYKSNGYTFGKLNAPCPTHELPTCTECERTMLLCRVVLGKVFPLARAQKFAHAPKGYNSVQGLAVQDGGKLNLTEYVVYNGEQAFAEFLITYVLTA